MLVPPCPPLAGLEQELLRQMQSRPGQTSEHELGRRLLELEQHQRQQKMQRQQLSWFRRELALLQELRHPNLVLFMGAATLGEAPPLIVSEFCAGGTLFRLLHERPSLRLSWSQKLKAASDTAKGMNFLHRRRVIHRDLKSLNLLLAGEVGGVDDPPWIKISDFGLSRRLPAEALASGAVSSQRLSIAPCPVASAASGSGADGLVMTGNLGTCLWMAPEVLSGCGYDERADVYSYGVVLYEIICRRLPFDGAPGQTAAATAARAVCAGQRPERRHVPPCCSAELKSLMEKCWAQRPDARPAFSDVLDELSALGRQATSPTHA
eukprot:gb/GFBE01067253.1/.p1 GENE.gb/GFBE01067253.1/~~gb/GFBE01067253.1/.p1  ORF type:complete len:322 (+),score=41.97 gb/GFBE01067253.1/:1-966(+)